jgi:hypothetical protein
MEAHLLDFNQFDADVSDFMLWECFVALASFKGNPTKAYLIRKVPER